MPTQGAPEIIDHVRQLQQLASKQLEQRHKRGYDQNPSQEDEFDIWHNEQAWPEQRSQARSARRNMALGRSRPQIADLSSSVPAEPAKKFSRMAEFSTVGGVIPL